MQGHYASHYRNQSDNPWILNILNTSVLLRGWIGTILNQPAIRLFK